MERFLNKIICGDCLEVMKEIPDKSVDLILTDPPYKMNHTTGSTTGSGWKEKWGGNLYAGDKDLVFDTSIKFSEWLPEIYRVLKEDSHCYIFCNDKNLNELMNEANMAKFKLYNVLVWLKNNCTPNRYYMKNCEFILFLRKGRAIPINDMGTKTVLEFTNINGANKLHPTEKPIDLLEVLIKNSSHPDDVILDLFSGSGTTAIAAHNTGRFFIGIEKSEEYCRIARERIERVKQLGDSLFSFP